jgi:pimeloyl-ACP methyl ester carboxylesterase
MELSYERRGSGSTLVLLHGIGHRWQAWEPVLDRLAEHHDVIAVDLPGFGNSPAPAAGIPAGMPEAVASVAEVFTTFELDRPHIAGNSLGGAIALELAAADLAASATAFSPAGFGSARQMRYALAVLQLLRAGAHLPAPVIKWGYRYRPVRTSSFAMLMRRSRWMSAEAALGDTLALRGGTAFRSVARAGRNYVYEGKPAVPVTVAWGSRDRILSPRMAAVARERLPEATHVDLPDCGHVPMGDDPDLVASVILDTTRRAV